MCLPFFVDDVSEAVSALSEAAVEDRVMPRLEMAACKTNMNKKQLRSEWGTVR